MFASFYGIIKNLYIQKFFFSSFFNFCNKNGGMVFIKKPLPPMLQYNIYNLNVISLLLNEL